MKLYHFTSAEHVAAVAKRGLTLGSIPIGDDRRGYRLIYGYQWLTDDPEWHGQGWATSKILTEDRTEFRFAVKVPEAHTRFLWRWPDVARHVFRFAEDDLAKFNRAGGSPDGMHWWVFVGNVPRGWLRGPERRPAAVLVGE